MANIFSNSWDLVKASAKVLNADKELMLFPILSALAMMVLTAVFFVPMLLVGFLNNAAQNGLQFLDYLVLFVFYVLQYFIIFFSNTALVGAALIRLRGGDPTVRDGLRIAWSRFVPIFGYALIAATVGLLLSMIRDRGKGVGRIISSLIGMVWNVATFLVVPILAVEEVGPIEAIKRSVAHLKRTWGEQLVGNFSFGAIFTLIGVVIVIGTVALGFLLSYLQFEAWSIIAVVIVAIILLMLLGLISSTLKGIYTAAVYQYATTGEAGQFFDREIIQSTFQPTR